jgi:HK97 family phage prohead protease
MPKKVDVYDFGGYATKNDLQCSDGRTIRRDAFKGNDGMKVPLVWHHLHDEPRNILGHAILENRDDGVYAYGIFNDTPAGQDAKKIVQHGDIVALSIYANELKQNKQDVLHGNIREVSLVVAGANPGALIQNVSFAHSDGTSEDSEEDVYIFTGLDLILPEPVVTHQEPVTEPVESVKIDGPVLHAASADKTVGDIIDSLTDEQKTAVYVLIDNLTDVMPADSGNTVIQQSNEIEGEKIVKTNVFDKTEEVENKVSLTHAQFDAIVVDAKKYGSFKTSILEHAVTYGIEDIDYLFPDARTLDSNPAMISRRMEWVTTVMNGVTHSPFSNVKNILADITADAARARGYVKASLKKDEVIKLLKRVTTPTTVYKKQKLDRDDILDITDLDVVAWMKAEMRIMLDEEIARAILVSDGRAAEDTDKIPEDHIRPIWTDDDMYAYHVRLDEDVDIDGFIDAVVRARSVYNGSGSTTLFTSSGVLSDMLLLKDSLGRRIYQTVVELQAVLRVSNIVEVPVMTGLTRESDDDTPVTLNLLGIVVNLRDYTIGANKGGEVSMFENFDIDYNQEKYLLETRISGALTLPHCALVIEQVGAAG